MTEVGEANLTAKILIGVEGHIVTEPQMKEVHEGRLARVTLPRDEYDDGQFLLWLEVELLQVVVAQHLLFPEDVLHEPVDVGKLARLRLEPHRMIEVPESAVHHLLGIDIVGKDDEVA